MAIDSSYNKPGVRIIQQVTSPSIANADPTLYTCIVGMCYQVVRDSSAGTYDGTSALYAFPNILGTATADASSVEVEMIKGDNTDSIDSSFYSVGSTGVTINDDVYAERLLSGASGATGDATNSVAVFSDSSAKFITWGVEDGDILTISGSGSNAGDYTVSSVDSETAITLTESLSATQSNLDYYITEVDYLGTGLGATVLISYRALRSDIDEVVTLENLSDASSQLGILTPDNPLGYGVYVALNNSNAKIKALGITADTQTAFASAAEILESHDVYCIVPLTQNTSVISVFKTHVDSMSAPAEKRERLVLVNRKLALRSILLESTGATVADLGSNVYSVTKEGAQFLTNGVSNGDLLYTSEVTETGSVTGLTSYTIRSVVSEDQVNIYSTVAVSSPISIFTIASQDFTKLEQAQFIRDYASSIEDKRVVLVWPDYVNATPESDSTQVEGYYLAAGIAGATSGLPAQQPFTRLKIAGFDSLVHSNLGYFTQSNLDEMASGGVMIMTQANSSSLVEIRHQLTTNMEAIEYREFSIVKNIDYIAKFLRERISPLVGKWNITNFFMQTLKVTLQGSFEFLKESSDIAGPNIISANIIGLEQNETTPDRVDVIVDIVIPYPSNDIRITLRI